MSDSDEDGIGIPLLEVSSLPVSPKKTSKRKHENDSTTNVQQAKKRKRSRKPKDVNDESLDAVLGVNHAIGRMDSSLMADHIVQRTRRFGPELSMVEMEDSYIPEKAIVDTTSWDKPRTADQLAEYIERFAGPRRKKKGKQLKDASAAKGHPHTLVIASSGMRAADLTRALRRFQTKDALVAKLFAKHIKLNEAVESVKKSRINIGVGTPQRVIALLEDGALSSSNLERVIIDASHIDQKKRGILDIREIQVPLVELLTRKELMERYGSGENQVELLFY